MSKIKKLLSIFAFTLSCFSAFAFSGVLSGEEDIRIVQTQWFDIIYPKSCEQTATILFDNADSLYEEICQEYGVKPEIRMPVVVTPALENFNAYWTDGPYNHIVVYDTAMIDDLSVFSETLLSTFKHELTHSVTYNLRTDFIKQVDKIFGDSISFSFWITSRGMGEGAAVAMESKDGEGRLNDEFAMHQVKQAKIQNVFPNYLDIQTVTDVYPGGVCYYFNGAFAKWLQNKYGMEKYAALWYRCVNLKSFTITKVFETVYEESLDVLWNLFIKDFSVPDIPADPVDAGFAKDLFGEKTNESGRIYTSLTNSSAGFAYLDDSTDSAYYMSWNDFETNLDAKPKKLFTLANVQSIKLSDDGRFMVVNYLSSYNSNYKKQIKIYDLKNACFYTLNETGVEDGCIFNKDESYYFACQSFHSQNYGIKFFQIDFDEKNGKIKNLKSLWQKEFNYEQVPSFFAPAGNGEFAYIFKNKLKYTICFCNEKGNITKEIESPKESSAIKYLAPVYNKNGERELSFSWAKKDSLPRLGVLNITKSEYELDEQDISGGVFFPVVNKSEENKTVVYIAKMFRHNKLFYCADLDYRRSKKEKSRVAVSSQSDSDKVLFTQALDSKKYAGSFKYYKKGLLIPFADLQSLSYNSKGGLNYAAPFGITYLTANPWDSNRIILSAGYGFETQSALVSLAYSGLTETGIFDYELSGTTEFDAAGFKQIYGSASFSSSLPVGTISFMGIQLSTFDYFGRSDFADSPDFENNFFTSNAFAVTYSNVHKTGPGRYQKGGVKISSLLSYQYLYSDLRNASGDYFDIGFTGTVYIPQLLPFDSKKGYVYNFPAKVSFNVFKGTDKSAVSTLWGMKVGVDKVSDLIGYDAACFEAETVLFGCEIQREIPNTQFLYAGELKLSIIYGGGFNYDDETANQDWHILKTADYLQKIKNQEMLYKDFVALDFSVGITPVFGNVTSTVFSFKLIPDFREKNVTFGISYTGRY